MAVTIKIKTAASAGVTPTTALEYGELAINQYTGVLYYKHWDATTPVIKAIGSNATVEGAVLITGNQTIAGTKTFSGLATSSTTLVTNLNADRLDSQDGSFYQNAGNLNAGTLPSARLVGSYGSITGVGALAAGSIASGFGAIDISGYGLTAGKATLATGTITTSQPAIDITQTWNASGVTFTGLKQNITDTASASGSLLLDLQTGGVSKFSVTKTGGIKSYPLARTVVLIGTFATGANQVAYINLPDLGFTGSVEIRIGGSWNTGAGYGSLRRRFNYYKGAGATLVAADYTTEVLDASGPVAINYAIGDLVNYGTNQLQVPIYQVNSLCSNTLYAEIIVWAAGTTLTHSSALIDGITVTAPATVSNSFTRNYVSFSQQLQLAAGTAAIPGIAFTGDTNTGVYNSAADTLQLVTGGVSRLSIDSTGNVGIGTASPLLRLEVAGSGRFTGASTSVLTGTIDAIASTTVTGVGTLFLTELVVGDRITITGETRAVTAIASNLSLTVDIATTDTANDTSPDKLAAIFVTRLSSNAIGMVQNDLGNLGIGTAAPADRLHINAGDLRIGQSNSVADTITNNINFVNTNLANTPVAAISVRTGSAVAVSNLIFQTAASGTPSEKMRIAGDGNVGIGTTAPAYTLDVTGTGRFTSTLLVSGATTLSSTLAVTGALTTTVGGGAGAGTQTMATQAYLNSRGMNLVANGIGALTNNYNFTGFVFDQTDTFTGKGSFKATVAGTVLNDEYIAIDIAKTYLLTLYAKTTQFTSLSTFYAGIAMFDIDNIGISPYNIMRQNGTDTRLLSPLALNDMVVVVASLANWLSTSTLTYMRSIIIWGYRNSFGYTYPDYTYSRFWITDSYFSTAIVCQLVLTGFGTGYTAGTYALAFSGGAGTGAAGSYIVDSSTSVVAVYMTAEGSGYTSAPTVSFPSGGGTTAAAATARITSNATVGTVEYLVKGASGSGFTGTTGTISFSGGGATTQATGYVTISSGAVDRIILTSQGSGYTSNPTVTITAGGTGATAYATIGTGIDATNSRIYLKSPFSSGFQNPVNSGVWPIGTALSNGSSGVAYKYIVSNATVPTAWTKFTGKIGGIDTSGLDTNYSLFRPGTATVRIMFLPNYTSITNCVISTTVLTAGSGYTSIPVLTFGTTPTAGSLTATGSAVMRVVSTTISSGGTGYGVGNIILVTGGTGTAATFQVATVSSGVVTTITALNTGGAYTVLPTLSAVDTTANPAGGLGLTLNLSMGIGSVTILTSGSGYSSGAPLLTSAASAGVTATLSCTLGNNIQNYSTISFTEVSDRNVAVFQPTTTTEVGLTVRQLSGQTAAMQEWQNSGAAVLASIGTSGQFLAGNTGSAASPGIAFTSDTNTGVYNSAADTLQLVTGGVARVTIDSAGNLNGPAGAQFKIVPAATYSLILDGNVSTAGSTMTTIGGAITVAGATTLSHTTSIQGSASHDLPTYSAEFLLATTWVSTGWTGSFATGWTHGTGNTNTLSHDKLAVTASKYQIAYTVTGRSAGSFTIAFGGDSLAGISATGAWGPTAVSTAALAITPTTDFDGVIVISIKSITGISTALVSIKSSDGTARIEIRANNASFNTFIGYAAGGNNTAGYNNTANGYASLYNNTTGYYNTANGASSLQNNTTGYYNTANGASSLQNNTTGYYNTAIGYASLFNNTTGYNNTANGYASLQNNTTGYNNTANGLNSLRNNTTGNNNTANGLNSLFNNTTGYYNTANGLNSLYNNTTGYLNTAHGSNAGRSLTTGNTNTFLGNDAGYHGSQLVSASNSMALGNGAYTTLSNQVVIGNTSVTQTLLNGNVGIGTTYLTTSQKLTVSGTGTIAARIESTSNIGARDAQLQLYVNNSGGSDPAGSILFNANNSSAVEISYGKIVVANTAAAAAGNGEMQFWTSVSGTATERMRINKDGNVGIGTTSPTNILSFGNSAAQKFWIENSASGTVGRALTVAAGGTVVGGTDITGGNLILQSGLGTGTGASTISFQTGATLGTGTTLQTMTTAMTILGNGNVGIGTATPAYKLDVAGTITGSSTVQGTRLISTIAIGTAPLTVTSTTAVTNLNADLLDGQEGTYYQNATNLNTGTVATARLASGTANATSVLHGDQTWGAPVGIVPVGAVLSWLKSFTNTPALSTEFIECNGQTLSDANSVYNGQTIPDLNAALTPFTKRFLRGSATSGTVAGSDAHTHTITTSSVSICSGGIAAIASVTSPTGSTSTLPSYYEVVWIMRIK